MNSPATGGSDAFAQALNAKAYKIRVLATNKRGEEIEHEMDNGGSRKYGGGQNIDISENGTHHGTWNEIFESYAWIEDLFREWNTLPDPELSKSLANQLDDVAGAGGLTGDGVASNIDPSGGRVEGGGRLGSNVLYQAPAILAVTKSDWGGVGASAFSDFISTINPAARNQIALGRVLRTAAVANHDMLKATRDSLQVLQKDTTTALEGVDPGGGMDAGAVATMLTIAGAASVIMTGGVSFPAAAAAVAAGTGIAADKARNTTANAGAGLTVFTGLSSLGSFIAKGKESKGTPPELGADTVDGVLQKMVDAHNTIIQDVDKAEDGLIEHCEANIDFIISNRNNGGDGDINRHSKKGLPLLVAPRPSPLTDVPPSKADENFKHP